MVYALEAFLVELERAVIHRYRYKNHGFQDRSCVMVRSTDLEPDGFSLNPSTTTQGQD